MGHRILPPPGQPPRAPPASRHAGRDGASAAPLRSGGLPTALLALAVAAPLAAQAPDTAGATEGPTTLEGTVVVDGTGDPVAAAYVELLGQGKGAFSDVEGQYVLQGLEPGWDTLRVRYLSWSSERVPVKVPERGVARLELSVPPPGIRAVEELVVQVDREAPGRLADFVRRMKSAGSAAGFLTREEILEQDPTYLSDALRRLPFVRMDADRRVQLFTRGVVSPRRMSDLFCRPAVLVDGARWPGSLDAIPPEIVLGVEVYRRVLEAPFRYQSYANGCGLVMVWTVTGG